MSGNILVPANIIEVRQGDSFDIYFHLKKDCRDYDLTGTTITMIVKDKIDKRLIFEKNADGVDLTNGRMVIQIYPMDTNNLQVGDYETQIRVIMPNGKIHTIFPDDPKKVGTFRITKKV